LLDRVEEAVERTCAIDVSPDLGISLSLGLHGRTKSEAVTDANAVVGGLLRLLDLPSSAVSQVYIESWESDLIGAPDAGEMLPVPALALVPERPI
jgi:hypothetical protein